jgi:4-amino-4-deoxy-L-arabinose transferase-like glycosyltransferase
MCNSSNTAILFGMIMLVLAAIFLSKDLATGEYLHYDEFYTLERSIGFEKHQDWLSVYSYNTRSARKPPLQYWLNGINFQAGLPELLSLRLWSFVFFISLLLTTALLSYNLSRNNPWVFPATILVMCCSLMLIRFGRSGMLESGMSFFLVASCLAFVYAKKKPWLWLLCGLGVGLGALQKTPIALFVMVVFVTMLSAYKDSYYRFSNLRKDKNFKLGVGIAITLLLSWHILQAALYGGSYFRDAFKSDMIDRFSPSIGSNGDMFKWVGWLWDDLSYISIITFLTLLGVVFIKRWRANRILFAFATILLIIFTVFTFASGKIYSRYLAIVIPFMIVLMIRVISDLIPWRPGVFVLSLCLFVLSAERISASLDYIHRENRFSKVRDMVMLLDSVRQDGDQVALDQLAFPPGAYGYFSDSLAPYESFRLTGERSIAGLKKHIDRELDEEYPIIGLTAESNMALFVKYFERLETPLVSNGFVVWRIPPSGHK